MTPEILFVLVKFLTMVAGYQHYGIFEQLLLFEAIEYTTYKRIHLKKTVAIEVPEGSGVGVVVKPKIVGKLP